MDNKIFKLLQEWHLEEYHENFESEGIDEESFDLLDADTIRILFPKAGPRLKFTSKFKDYIQIKVPESHPESTLPEKSTLLVQPSEMAFESTVFPMPSTSREPIQMHSTQLSPSLGSCLPEGSSELNINLLKLVEKKLPEIYHLLHEGDPSKISYLHKLSLNRLVVDTYVEKNGVKITTHEKINLAKSIVKCFPILKGAGGEGYEQFFCPGIKGSAASGFIAQRLKNFRHRNLSIAEKEELGIGFRKKSLTNQTTAFSGKEDTSVDFLQKQYWLKVNDNPSDKVLQFMAETFSGRRYNINKGSSERILDDWPQLIRSDVIDAEFVLLYDSRRGDRLCLEFEVITDHLILQARHCGRKAAEDLVKEFSNDLTKPSAEKVCCALLLLPLLLPQGIVIVQKGNKKRRIRPTNSEDHFIQFIPVGAGIDNFMKEGRTLGGERTQPFILAIGEKFRPTQTFVILEDKCIETSSLLKAVDLCYKLYFVLNLKFPPYCQNVWYFLNESFYQCDSMKQLPSCVIELKNRLFISAQST